MNNIITTEDGSHSLESTKFGVTYHSIHGAIQESQVVFIDAALNYQMDKKDALSILEIGFGTGLNAFMTYLEAKKRDLKIEYIGVEAYPIDALTLEQLNYAEELDAITEREALLSMHSATIQPISLLPNFSFHQKIATFESLDYKGKFDIIYYDAFAPNAQPELWEESMLVKMFDALKPGGVLTTYCAKGAFKRSLKKIGFTVEALPGPKGKREMTRAIK